MARRRRKNVSLENTIIRSPERFSSSSSVNRHNSLVGLFSLSVYDNKTLSEDYEAICSHLTGFIYEPLSPSAESLRSGHGSPLADPYGTGTFSFDCFGAVVAVVAGITFASFPNEVRIVVTLS